MPCVIVRVKVVLERTVVGDNNTSFQNYLRPEIKTDSFAYGWGRNARAKFQICPGFNANEIQIPYDKQQDVSSLVKSHQTTHNPVKYEVI